MNFIRNNLTAVLLFTACIAGLYVYETYFTGGSSDVLTSSAATTTPASADILASLSNLQQVTLDPSIFSDPVFVSLVDFGIAIPPQPVGRSDPFAPLTGAGASGSNAGVAPAVVQSAPHS